MNTVTTAERIEKATSEVPLLNESQKEALHLLDTSTKTRIQAAETSDLIGVIAGIKPVAFLSNTEVNSELIADIGIKCEPMTDGLFAASRDDHLNAKLKNTFLYEREEDGRMSFEGHRTIGKLLGYPESATEYFIERFDTVFSEDELPVVIPRSTLDTPTEFFHQFILSPNNYQDEINTYIRPLEIAVKELAPHTYKFIEKEYRHQQTRKKMGAYLRPLLGMKPKEIRPGISTIFVD